MGLLKILRKIKQKEKQIRLLILYFYIFIFELLGNRIIYKTIMLFTFLIKYRGLDNSGKTTIVKSIMGEDVSEISPTLGFTINTLKYKE